MLPPLCRTRPAVFGGQLVVVQTGLVWEQRPDAHGNERNPKDPTHHVWPDYPVEPRADGGGSDVIDDRGDQNGQDEGDRLAELGGQDQREKLRLVSDFRDADDTAAETRKEFRTCPWPGVGTVGNRVPAQPDGTRSLWSREAESADRAMAGRPSMLTRSPPTEGVYSPETTATLPPTRITVNEGGYSRVGNSSRSKPPVRRRERGTMVRAGALAENGKPRGWLTFLA